MSHVTHYRIQGGKKSESHAEEAAHTDAANASATANHGHGEDSHAGAGESGADGPKGSLWGGKPTFANVSTHSIPLYRYRTVRE